MIDLILSPLENLKLINKQLTNLAYMKDIRAIPSLVRQYKIDIQRLQFQKVLSEPMEILEYQNEINDINQKIRLLERRFKQLNLMRVDINGGEEYLGFAKQKLSYLKGMMLQSGIDIGKQKYYIGDDNDTEVLIQSHKGYDLIRISQISGYDRIFLYNEFGCSYWGQEDFTNCSLIKLCYMQVYKLLTDKKLKKYILSGAENVDINYGVIFLTYWMSDYAMAVISNTKQDSHAIYGHYKEPKVDIRMRPGFNDYNRIYSDWSFQTSIIFSRDFYVTPISPSYISAGYEGSGYSHNNTVFTNKWGFYKDILEEEKRIQGRYLDTTRTQCVNVKEGGYITSGSGSISTKEGQLTVNHQVKYLHNPYTDLYVRYISDYDIKFPLDNNSKPLPEVYVASYIIEDFMNDKGGIAGSSSSFTQSSLEGHGEDGHYSSKHYSESFDITTINTKYYLIIKVNEKITKKELASNFFSYNKTSSNTYSRSGSGYYAGNRGFIFNPPNAYTDSPTTTVTTELKNKNGTLAHGFSCQINNKFLVYTYIISQFTDSEDGLPIINIKKVIGIVNLLEPKTEKDLDIGYNQEFEYFLLNKENINFSATDIGGSIIKKHPVKEYSFRIGYFNPMSFIITDEENIVKVNDYTATIKLKWKKKDNVTGYIIFVNDRIWKVLMNKDITTIDYNEFSPKGKMYNPGYSPIYVPMVNIASIGADFKLSNKKENG